MVAPPPVHLVKRRVEAVNVCAALIDSVAASAVSNDLHRPEVKPHFEVVQMADLSPKRVQEHIDALDGFRTSYEAFLEHDDDPTLRSAVIDKIPAADDALDAAGSPALALDPPQVQPQHQYHGLRATAFLYEQPGFRDLRALIGAPEMYERLLDHVAMARATLGTGEIGTVGTAAAIANAVYHATGRRIRDLPRRLERIL